MKINGKVISVLITGLVLSLLLIAGPATAFVLGISISQKYVNLGDNAKFNISTTIGSNENLEVTKFTLNLDNKDGSEHFSCEFLPNGTFLSECNGFIINDKSLINQSVIKLPGYGYGYGYGYAFNDGKLAYNIGVNTSMLGSGIFSTKIIMNVSDNIYEENGGDLFVVDPNGLKGCSIRASKGVVQLNDYNGFRNRFSLNIPLRNAVPGSGSLQSQGDKTRVVYEFRVVGTVDNNPNSAYILVNGNYRENRTNKSGEISIIYLDKKNKELSLAGKNVNAQTMKVTLLNRC